MNKKINLINLRPSGLVLGIIIGAASVFAVQSINFSKKMAANALPGRNSTICNLSQMPASNLITGIITNQDDYNVAINRYQQAHPSNEPGVTWGGSIGKNHLIAIINSLGSEATEVNFKFITNQINNKTSLYFQGGIYNVVTGEAGNEKLYIRTGTAAEAFCPSRCN
jgi:hypothetical protein